MADDTLVLDLKTVTGKFHVRIDGVPHFLSHPDALTLYQRTQLELMAPRIEQLTAVLKDGAALPDAEARELEALLDRSVRMVLDAPDVVHRKLSDVARASILNAFFALRSPKETGTGTPTQSPPTGLRSSRDSSGSTAALQTVG